MNDVLPDEVGRWQLVERIFAREMSLHGYREVRTPCVEGTALFVRSIGESTDVVEKEMYSFEHHHDSLTLRPEGTAGAARAFVEHAVQAREPVTRWWYAGPMFRAERPQRGRYRQFAQIGAEIFGDEGPACDAEMITMLVGLLRELLIADVDVVINTLGGPETRARYRQALVEHLTPIAAGLSADSQRRLVTNPLRILDSKDERDRQAIADAPSLHAFLDDADREHFAVLQKYLDALGTPYRIDPKLVRGLDYYTRTSFEIRGAEQRLGAGSTLVGGGRYDGLVAALGGPPVPAIGFAAGVERILVASDVQVATAAIDAWVAPVGSGAVAPALGLASDLRRQGIRCEVETRGSSLKSQLRRADARGARVVLILGDDELTTGSVQVKDLEAHSEERMRREDTVRVVVDRLVAARRTVDAATARAPGGPS